MPAAPLTSRRVVLRGLGPFLGPALSGAIKQFAPDVTVRQMDNDEPVAARSWDLLLTKGSSVALGAAESRVIVLYTEGSGSPPPAGRSGCDIDRVDLVTLLMAITTDDWSVVELLSARGAAVEPRLSSREREVLAELALGHDGQSVAQRLGISAKTVDNHKQSIYRKLGVQSQAHVVRRAAELGILTVRRSDA